MQQRPLLAGIGRTQPRTVRETKYQVVLGLDVYNSLKLLAFVREETLGRAVGRAIRHALDDIAARYVASGALDPECAGLTFEEWPLSEQINAFVPEHLHHRIGPEGQTTNLLTYGKRPETEKMVCAPLSHAERQCARLAAFSEMSNVSRWGEECVKRELLAITGLELWTLPHDQQVQILLVDEERAWDVAVVVVSSPRSRSVLSTWAPRLGPTADELLIETTDDPDATPSQPCADGLSASESATSSSPPRADSDRETL
jgi:hypothetical protein